MTGSGTQGTKMLFQYLGHVLVHSGWSKTFWYHDPVPKHFGTKVRVPKRFEPLSQKLLVHWGQGTFFKKGTLSEGHGTISLKGTPLSQFWG